jgi:hypothetical protein
VYRRCFLVCLALEILVGDGTNAGAAVDLNPHGVVDTDQSAQHHAALFGIGVLDQHGGFPVAAVRHQWIVGGKLFGDAFFFEDALGPQHFLYLIANSELVLENERDMFAHMDDAAFLMRHHACAKFSARF